MTNYQNPRVFGFNYCQQEYGGSVSVSSGSSTMWYATDNNKYTRWVTSGQAGSSQLASWTRGFGASRTIDCIYVFQTNIHNINFVYGTGDTPLPNVTVMRCEDLSCAFFKFDPVPTTQIKGMGTETITAGEEKYINEVYAMEQVGQFELPILFKGGIEKSQIDHKLESGKHFVINKGSSLHGKITFKSHISTADVDLYNTILSRDSEFHIWFNGGDEGQFKYLFYPYRFEDMFKVSILKGAQPSFRKNFYGSGLNSELEIVEVE